MKKGLRIILKLLLILIAPPIIYLIFAIIGSLIPVNSNSKPTESYTEIYLYKQDMHTDILLPVHSKIIHWDSIFKPQHTLGEPQNPKFIGFGWGDLQFYRNTPQWEDLKANVAFKALFLKSQSALHTRFYEKTPVSENLVKISVNEKQYSKLKDYILATLSERNSKEVQPIPDLQYYRNDAFYSAKTSFSLFKTCNTWTNSALKSSGLKACLWTPFPQGIFLHY